MTYFVIFVFCKGMNRTIISFHFSIFIDQLINKFIIENVLTVLRSHYDVGPIPHFHTSVLSN